MALSTLGSYSSCMTSPGSHDTGVSFLCFQYNINHERDWLNRPIISLLILSNPILQTFNPFSTASPLWGRGSTPTVCAMPVYYAMMLVIEVDKLPIVRGAIATYTWQPGHQLALLVR